jgi:hypothetical protein
MKIAKAGNIHNFCHPNSLLTLQVSVLQSFDSTSHLTLSVSFC